jgi:hypothetical protein
MGLSLFDARSSRGDFHDALGTTGQGTCNQGVHRLVAVIDSSQQHGQIHACYQFATVSVDYLLRNIARRSAQHIGEYEDSIIGKSPRAVAYLCQRGLWRRVSFYIHGMQAIGYFREYM